MNTVGILSRSDFQDDLAYLVYLESVREVIDHEFLRTAKHYTATLFRDHELNQMMRKST